MAFVVYGVGKTYEKPINPARPPRTIQQVDQVMGLGAVTRKQGETEGSGEHPQEGSDEPSPSFKQVLDTVYHPDMHIDGQHREAILAHEIMTAPVKTLGPDAELDDAWSFIRANRYRHVPIVDGDGTLVGIISDRDLLKEAVHIGKATAHSPLPNLTRPTIRELVKDEVLTATPDTPIREIAKMLIEERIGAMPIMDANGRLEGIITRSDILRALINKGPLQIWV